MTRTILSHGLAAGLIVGVPMGLLATLVPAAAMGPWGMAIGYLMMLVALVAVFAGVKRHRDTVGGGVIRFWPALGLGLAISAVAAFVYAVAWEAALALSGMDFGRAYGDMLMAQARAEGASAERLARLSRDMDAFARDYRNPLWRFPMTMVEILPVGLLVSLASAALLRNPRVLPARG